MMNNFSSLGGSAAWFHVHMIFGAVAIIGVILFIVWGIRHLKKEHLLNWSVVLIIIGIIGTLLTASSGAWFFRSMGFGGGMMGSGQGMMMGGMIDCVQDKECFEGMETMMERMMQHDENEQ